MDVNLNEIVHPSGTDGLHHVVHVYLNLHVHPLISDNYVRNSIIIYIIALQTRDVERMLVKNCNYITTLTNYIKAL